MTSIFDISETLEALKANAPSGFALAMRINFSTPSYLFQTFSTEWTKEYSQQGYVVDDPVVLWGVSEIGVKRWSDLAAPDQIVFKRSAEYGLTYGVACATNSYGSQSFCGIARPDREFTDAECDTAHALFLTFHQQVSTFEAADPGNREQLRLFASQVSEHTQKV